MGATQQPILRDDDGRVRAFHNLCSHRGTLLCPAEQGTVGGLPSACPDHQWTYTRSGTLNNCRGMQPSVAASELLGLNRSIPRRSPGFASISLAAEPPDSPCTAKDVFLNAQGFERAKVAKAIDYTIAANWKLVWRTTANATTATPLIAVY